MNKKNPFSHLEDLVYLWPMRLYDIMWCYIGLMSSQYSKAECVRIPNLWINVIIPISTVCNRFHIQDQAVGFFCYRSQCMYVCACEDRFLVSCVMIRNTSNACLRDKLHVVLSLWTLPKSAIVWAFCYSVISLPPATLCAWLLIFAGLFAGLLSQVVWLWLHGW